MAAAAGGLCFAGFICSALPAGVAAVNDDFGYLRSVVATLQHGRPLTDDWLEPWSAGLSALSALAYTLTGSFQLATQGVQAALAGVAFFALAQLLRGRGTGPTLSLAASAALLTVPTVHWKMLEYTGLILSLPCLLLALLAADRRRWGLFFVIWAVALTTRQSAAAWGMLPLVAAAKAWRESGGAGRWWRPALTVAGGAMVYLLTGIGMNKTHAQVSVMDRMFENLLMSRATELAGIGTLVFIGAAGFGTLLLPTVRRRPQPGYWLMAAGLVAGIAGLIEWHDRIYLEHARYGGAGTAYLPAWLALGATGWLLGRFRLNMAECCAGAAALLLVCLRRDVWDYYLIDVFVFGLFASRSGATTEIASPAATKLRRWVTGLAAASVLGVHGIFIAEFKAETDRRWAAIDLSERALRESRMDVRAIRFLPFGYVGWELFPASLHRTTDGRTEGANFYDYLEEGGHAVRLSAVNRLPGRHADAPEGQPHAVVLEDSYPFLWCGRANFQLIRFAAGPSTASKQPLPEGFIRPVFPLNDAEWAALIAGERPSS